MSEKYVKDILEKLEEIENLHAKLRNLVPRVKNQEQESIDRLKNADNKEPISIDINESNVSQRQFIDNDTETLRNVGVSWCVRYLKKLRSPSFTDKYRKLRKSSVNFVSNQWRTKKDKLKNLLSTISERNIILVNRAAQTSDDEQSVATSRKQSTTGGEEVQFSSRGNPEKRKATMPELLERLLEHFNYSRDSDIENGGRVSIHDHPLGNNEPRRVLKTLLLPDDEAETSNIISSAKRVSIDRRGENPLLNKRKNSFATNLMNHRTE
ncbi:uncharacterized protein LOC128881571 [Hylaeus volcanicus]|uniref:uncharacterized protein LOC128881571 n=1 Tax=Hylaeus volcanicus TaxID=313075 RepID=UPI0023B7AC45|nr:uncharacterized protein LOC128881571 [Hylaeus volcanicus]